MKKKAISHQVSNIIWAIIKSRRPKNFIVNGGKMSDQEFERAMLSIEQPI